MFYQIMKKKKKPGRIVYLNSKLTGTSLNNGEGYLQNKKDLKKIKKTLDELII